MKYKQIATELGIPWLELDIDIPHEDMLQEAIGLKEEFVWKVFIQVLNGPIIALTGLYYLEQK